MTSRSYQEFLIPVDGGELAVNRWPADRPGAPVMLAVHGIAGNGLSWAAVAEQLRGFDVVAPDLRGRAGSRSASGPYGLGRHADDLIAMLDHLGVAGRVPLVGHSMGAFIACVAAVRYPDRFSSLVLVDGGLGFPVPEGGDVDAILEAVIGPAMRKLTMEFATRAEYREFWRDHPAFGDIMDEHTLAYIDRDLVGEPPHLRSSCVADAIRRDGADVLRNPDVLSAIHRTTVPATLLWARRGMLNQPQGLYSPETLADGLPTHITAREIPGTNHYSILLGKPGAAAIAELVRESIPETLPSQ